MYANSVGSVLLKPLLCSDILKGTLEKGHMYVNTVERVLCNLVL